MLPTADLLVSPEFPVAGLGIRARAKVTDAVTLLAGVFNGRPIPKNSPNTPASNPHGVSFPLNTGVFAIAELQFTFPGSGASTKTNGEGPLPGTYKIGAWYDSDSFNDLQDDNQGVPLASPASNGMPATHHGNYSIYGVADQMIWRSKDPNRNVNLFVRPMFTTLQGRNLISFSVDGGLTLHEPLPGRDNDVFGLGFGVARVTNSASGFDRQILPALGLYAHSQQRNLSRGDLSNSIPALVADSARPPVCHQSRRRNRQSERSDPADQERVGDRPAHEHHVLTRLGRQAADQRRSQAIIQRPTNLDA